MKLFSSKFGAALVPLLVIIPLVLAADITIQVENVAPVFQDSDGESVLPSDGGSSASAITKTGEAVEFKATAFDANGDSYYLAICKTEAITAVDGAAPTCDDSEWVISAEPVESGAEEVLSYVTTGNEKRFNDWYAFVCDAVPVNSICSPVSQGEGDFGSPFVTPSKLRGVLRFGSTECADLADLEQLVAEEQDVTVEQADAEELTERQLLKMQRKLTRREKRALRRQGREGLIEKRERLEKLATVNPNFCLQVSDQDRVEDLVARPADQPKMRGRYDIDREELKLTFAKDQKRSIEIDFQQRSRQQIAEVEGLEVAFADPNADSALTSNPSEDGVSVVDSAPKTITLRHEESPAPTGLAGLLDGLLGEEEAPVSYELSVFDPVVEDDETKETVVYESSDNRKVEVYEVTDDPTAVYPHTIKNYTVYQYGDGREAELYTIENSVLHLTDSGVIEGYYFEDIDLRGAEGAEGVSGNLLDRAARTLAKDRAEDLHNFGGPNPDFIIPVPFALDKDNNLIDGLTYEITGEFFNQLEIRFNASETDYPLVLDPSLAFTAPGVSNANDEIEGNSQQDSFSTSATTGDFNGDGLTDIAVGASSYNNNSRVGRVYIFYNDGAYPTGAASADVEIAGPTGGASEFGKQVVTGDIDFDGTEDLLVGADRSSIDGDVYVFFNDGSWPSGADSADISIDGENVGDLFGRVIATGDLDGDGDDDIAVGATGYDATTSDDGRAYIFYSNANGTLTSNNCTSCSAASDADETFTGENNGDTFGAGLAVGDLDNDGDDDLVVAATSYNSSTGRLYILYNDGSYPAPASADVIIDGEGTSQSFGQINTIADYDNDGDDDLISSTQVYSSNRGRVYLFDNDGSYPSAAGSADEIISNTGSADRFALSIVADVNNDGFNDIVVGGHFYSSNAGGVFVFYGDGTGVFEDNKDDADMIITGESGVKMGNRVLGGDFNGDGSIDLAVSASTHDTNRGKLYFFYGEGVSEHANTFTGESTSDDFGYAIEIGDLNDDGTDDLVVGARGYDNGGDTGRVYIFYNDGYYQATASADVEIAGASTGDLFGSSLAIGDLDEDGDEDLVVGAIGHSTSTGRAYIFYGDGSIPTTAGSADVTITGGATSDQFGVSLATGDLNADGTIDLLVGADGVSSSAGAAYIFHNDGSIPTTAGTADVTITGTSGGDQFGLQVATGDLNDDGETDLLVSAPGTTNGTAYIFHNDGTIPTTAGTADVTITGGASGDNFGSAIVTADLDADGTTDLAIGADGVSTSAGAAYIFHNDGSIPTTAGTADVTITGESSSGFGNSLAVGDLNVDGEVDLIVGADEISTNTGKAYIFFNDGSIPTTAATADIIITGDASNDEFSAALATGDLDANGTTDLAIGAWGHSTDTGRTYLFFSDNDYSYQTEYPYTQSISGEYRTGHRLAVDGSDAGDSFGNSFAAGDFDNDGTLDIAVGQEGYGSNQGRIHVFYNDGRYGTKSDDSDLTIEGTASTSKNFGVAIEAADIDHDGDTDLIASASAEGNGKVYIFHNDGSYPANVSSADITITGAAGGDKFGASMAVGDLNADGTIDLLVGADGVSSDTGAAYIFHNDGSIPTTAGTADVTITGASTSDRFGLQVSTGDLNDDGETDLLVSAPFTTNGTAYIFHNDGSIPTTAGTADVTITGASSSDRFGGSLATGDFNDDGTTDLAIGAYVVSSSAGAAYIFHNDGSIPTTAGTADVTITGTNASDEFGIALNAGDFNRDGNTDLAVGAEGFSSDAGQTYLFYNDGSIPTTAATADALILGDTSSNSGRALIAGDFNRDGWDELLIGAPTFNSGEGRFSMYEVGYARIAGEATSNNFGTALAVGDLDFDGDDDLVVGADGHNSNQGRAYIFFDDMSFPTSGVDADIIIDSTGGNFGITVAIGDLDGDGDEDLAVGDNNSNNGAVRIYHNDRDGVYPTSHTSADITITGESGSFFSAADMEIGDLDGDGDDDLVVGAYEYNGSDGRVYIFDNDGSIPTTAATADTIITGGTDEKFGREIEIFDYDFDGDMDLAASAPSYSTETGRVYIFENDGSYPSATSSADVTITGEGTSDHFGEGLVAGDLNNDGLTDLVVGAFRFDGAGDEGQIYIFNNDGAFPTTAATADTTIVAGCTDCQLGRHILVGDYTNDGFNDLMVSFDDGIYVFYGDDITQTNTDDADLTITDNVSDSLKDFVMGDFNKDGHSDLVVGNYADTSSTGVVQVHLGEVLEDSGPLITTDPSEVWGNSWTSQTTGTTSNILAVWFADEDTGWIVGQGGMVRKTTDGGDNWSAQTSGHSDNIDAIWCADTNTCYASGGIASDYFMIKTTNGGTNWTTQLDGQTPVIAGVYCGDSSTCWAVEDAGALWYTDDGGDNWNEQTTSTSNQIQKLTAIDANTAYAVGNSSTIIKTTNGGTNWTTQTAPSGTWVAIGCADASTCWAGDTNGDIAYTSNGGTNWSEQTTNLDQENYQIREIFPISTTEVWVVTVTGDGHMLHTTDAGTTWVARKNPSSDTLTNDGLYFVDQNTGWVASYFGELYKTTNGGLGTTSESTSSSPTHVGSDVEFNAIATDTEGNDYYLIACKTSGLPTPSGGTGDAPECDGGSSNRWGVSSATDSGDRAIATYTVQAGDSESEDWYGFVCNANTCSPASQGSGNSGSPFAVNHQATFGTVNVGDSTGGTGTIEPGDTIYFNVDVAALADADTGGAQDTLNMYVCTDGSTFNPFASTTAAHCDGGTLICSDLAIDPTSEDAECDDGGSQAPDPTSDGTKDFEIFFEDNHDLEASGTTAQTYSVADVAPSFTIGPEEEMWEVQTSGTSTNLESGYFADADTAWAVGSGGLIRKSTDGGASWSAQTSNTAETLNDIKCVDTSTCWAIGNNGAITATTDGGSNWATQTSGTSEHLFGIHCINTNDCFAVGTNGTIRKTTDGGSNWSSSTSGTSNRLNDVYCTDDQTCWAVGASGTILTTTDGGSTTWGTQTDAIGSELEEVHMTVDGQTGWITNRTGEIQKTTNGGGTWTEQTSPLDDAIIGTQIQMGVLYAYDENHVWAGGGISGTRGDMMYTSDGGTTWTRITSGQSDDYIADVTAIDAHTALAFGYDGHIAKFRAGSSQQDPTDAGDGQDFKAVASDPNGDDYYLLICKNSEDPTPSGGAGDVPECGGGSGDRWAVSAAANDDAEATATYTTLTSDDEENVWYGWVCDADGCSAFGQGVFDQASPFDVNQAPAITANSCYATESGDTTDADPEPGQQLQLSCEITDDNEDVITASFCDSSGFSDSTLACTSEELCKASVGKNWILQDPALTISSGVDQQMRSVFCLDESFCWAGSRGGEVTRTTDGGHTWSSQAIFGSGKQVFSVEFPEDANTGYAAGNGEVEKTTDGGENWSAQTINNTGSIYYTIECTDNDTCIIVGSNGDIETTTNGGSNWTDRTSGVSVVLYDVMCAPDDADTCYVAGTGEHLKTTDGGVNWSDADPGNDVSVGLSIHVFDVNTAIIGTSNAQFYKTTDGGTNWTQQNSPTITGSHIYGISFIDENYGWATASNSGELLYTSDGGANWYEQESPIDSTWDIHMVDRYNGMLVGASTDAANPGEYRGHIYRMSDGFVDFKLQTSGTSNAIGTIDFIDQDYGWLGASLGTIRNTTDGGETWNSQTSNTSNNISRIEFVNAEDGFAVGLTSTIRATTDGGTTWNTQTADTGGHFYGMDVVSSDVAYIGGANGNIEKTTDAGSNWNSQTSNVSENIRSISCFDANTCYAVGDDDGIGGDAVITYTSNGGTNWTAQTSNTTNDLLDVACVSASECFAVGNAGVIVTTTDSGSNWSTQTSGTGNNIYDIACTDTETCFAAVAGGKVLVTYNGGDDWNLIETGDTDSLFGIEFIDEDHGWIGGSGGILFETLKGIDDWQQQVEEESSLDGIFFADDLNGWAVGPSGTIINTDDGGITWSAQTSGTGNGLSDPFCTDSDDCWITGASGTILATTDGGSNWSSQTSGSSESLGGLYFVDANTGWVAGSNGEILSTTNGGTNWSSQTSGTSEGLKEVSCADSSNCWVVGDTGTILNTSNGGTNWSSQTSGTSEDLRDVEFADSSNGFAVGDTGTILATTNGGTNWSAQTSGTSQFLDNIYCIDKNTCWVVGDQGTVLYTTDAGGNWVAQVFPNTDDLRGVHMLSTGAGWVTAGGDIFATTNGGSRTAICTETDSANADLYIGIPTAHGNTSYKPNLYDQHEVVDDSSQESQNVDVEDISPTLVHYTSPSDPSIAAGGNTALTWDVRVQDNNGTSDITAVSGVFFDVDAVTDSCSADDNDCYIDSSCADQGDVASASCSDYSNTCADYECSVTVYYNANASANWELSSTATDGTGAQNFTDSNQDINIPALAGLAVVETSIAYGSIEAGNDSSEQETSVGNVGNVVIDHLIEGTDLCTTACADSIDESFQRWDATTGFDYDNDGHPLDDTSSAGSFSNGCANVDLAVRDDAQATTENESIYWILRVPDPREPGSYTGTNTFSSISSTSCTGTP